MAVVKQRPPVDVDASPLPALGLAERLRPFAGVPHAHARGQLLYSAEGHLQLVAERTRWLLPPQRAAWIPPGLVHAAMARQHVQLATVYFAPAVVPGAPADIRVFAASPLLREMVMQAAAWGPEGADEASAQRFFDGLAAMIPRWAAEPLAFRLPLARTEALERAMDWTRAHMAEAPTIAAAAREAGLSERSLARRFAAEAGMTWRTYLRTARLLEAMAALAEPGARVSDAAWDVGFESVGAFSRAFAEYTGERPRAYRDRVQRR